MDSCNAETVELTKNCLISLNQYFDAQTQTKQIKVLIAGGGILFTITGLLIKLIWSQKKNHEQLDVKVDKYRDETKEYKDKSREQLDGICKKLDQVLENKNDKKESR